MFFFLHIINEYIFNYCDLINLKIFIYFENNNSVIKLSNDLLNVLNTTE